jgi:hypothetical protein
MGVALGKVAWFPDGLHAENAVWVADSGHAATARIHNGRAITQGNFAEAMTHFPPTVFISARHD